MADPEETEVSNLGTYRSIGSLLIVVGVLSYGISKLHGEWPAGFDGIVGLLFVVFGVVSVGISLTAQSRARRLARS